MGNSEHRRDDLSWLKIGSKAGWIRAAEKTGKRNPRVPSIPSEDLSWSPCSDAETIHALQLSQIKVNQTKSSLSKIPKRLLSSATNTEHAIPQD